MARVNVVQVFAAFLDGKSKSVGPVRCDANAIYSYGQPLLVRDGKRLLICQQGRSLYTRTTTQHLSSLYSLLIPHERDYAILRVPADDVRHALRSDECLAEVVIKHDAPITGAYVE